MAIRLLGLRWLALDPPAQARFWAELLDAPVRGTEVELAGLSLEFVATDHPKTVQSRIHLDLTSETEADQAAQVATALRLGGRHADVGQGPEEDHVVLADPEGHELCVVAAGNRFLAGTGRVGAINCDGTRALGVFWSRVLGWPLVWDQDEETAIQAPAGGTKVTWSGPPLLPRDDPDPVGFVVAADGPGDLTRLTGLGAHDLGGGRFLDPDGNELLVRTPPAG